MNAVEISLFAIPAAFVAFKLVALAVAALSSVHAVFGLQRPDYSLQLPLHATDPGQTSEVAGPV